MNCPVFSYSSNGMLVAEETCATGTTCPVLCGLSAQTCTSSNSTQCLPLSTSCPLQCSSTQQLCTVKDFGRSATAITQQLVCTSADVTCPCGANSRTCLVSDPVFHDLTMSQCLHKSHTCPVTCDPVSQKTCFPISFSEDGSINSTLLPVCVSMSEACPCGRNAMPCTQTDPLTGITRTSCLPKLVDGLAQSCPLTCPLSQSLCQVLHYDASGNAVNVTRQCVQAGTPCPCGMGTIMCKSSSGSPTCLAAVNAETNASNTCPSYCDPAAEDTCSVPSFTINGTSIGILSFCVGKGKGCDCSRGANTKPCTYTSAGITTFECVFTGQYCPAQCSGSEIPCPAVQNFLTDGTLLSTTAPTGSLSQPYCASTLDGCGCGQEAHQCSHGGLTMCLPLQAQCPLHCATWEKICVVTNYDAAGNVVSQKPQCFAKDLPCPCTGTKSTQCPGQSLCVASALAASLCPCDATQTTCFVQDYSLAGVAVGSRTVCTPLGSPCPCGKNTQQCTNLIDATSFTCQPLSYMDGPASCPQPCTPAQELNKMATCIQTHLDTSGNFLSQTVSCVPVGSCRPGRNMKQCATGAIISAATPCRDPYALAGASALVGVDANSSMKATLSFVLRGVQLDTGNLSALAPTLAAASASALQLLPSLSLDLKLLPLGSGRRLATGAASIQVVMQIQNLGSSLVSPATIALVATTGTPAFSTAFAGVGTMGPLVATSSSAAVVTVADLASLTTPPPATAPPSSTSTIPDFWQLIPVTTTSTSTPPLNASGGGTPAPAVTGNRMGPAGLIGGIIGAAVVVVVAIAGLMAFLYVRRQKSKVIPAEEEVEASEEAPTSRSASLVKVLGKSRSVSSNELEVPESPTAHPDEFLGTASEAPARRWGFGRSKTSGPERLSRSTSDEWGGFGDSPQALPKNLAIKAMSESHTSLTQIKKPRRGPDGRPHTTPNLDSGSNSPYGGASFYPAHTDGFAQEYRPRSGPYGPGPVHPGLPSPQPPDTDGLPPGLEDWPESPMSDAQRERSLNVSGLMGYGAMTLTS